MHTWPLPLLFTPPPPPPHPWTDLLFPCQSQLIVTPYSSLFISSRRSINWKSESYQILASWLISEAVAQRCSVKNAFLEISQNSLKNTCARVSFLIKFLAQMFSCEFCKISKNTFFYRTPLVVASVIFCTDQYLLPTFFHWPSFLTGFHFANQNFC